MAKYLVQVKEILSRTYVVEAEDECDAEDITESAYSAGEIVLDVDDFEDNIFSARPVTNEDLSLYTQL